MARRIAGRWWHNTRREKEEIEGATDQADEHAHEPDAGAIDRLDAQRVLDEIVKLLLAHGVGTDDADEMGRRLMNLILELTPDEIAEITGKSYEASKKEAQRTLAMVVAHIVRVGLHDIGLPGLALAGGAAMLFFLVIMPSGNRLVRETYTALIYPHKPVDPMPKDVPPGPGGERDLLDDAEQALKEGNFDRCTADAQNARFHGADPARLGDITRRCQELGDRNAPAPTAIASSSPTPAPKGPAPKVPAPVPQRPVAPEQMRTLQPLK
jgi:hypothetical protein